MRTYALGIGAGIAVLIFSFITPSLIGLSVGVGPAEVNIESNPLDSVPEEFNKVGTAAAGFTKTDAFITSDGKPVIFFFGTSSCYFCQKEKKPFLEVAAEFGKNISVHYWMWESSVPTADDTEVFNNFRGDGVPLVIIAGRYYRVGAYMGEGEQAEQAEKEALRSLIRDVLDRN